MSEINRNRHALTVAASSWLAKAAAASSYLLALLFLSWRLPIEDVAAFGIVASLSMWLYQSEFGFAVAMQNLTVRLKADRSRLAHFVSGCFVLSVLTVSGLAIVAWLLAPYVSNVLFRSLTAIQPGAGAQLVFLATVLFSIQGHGQIGLRMLYAFGLGFLANMLTLFAHVCGLVLLVCFFELREGEASVALALLAMATPLSIVSFGAWLALFARYGARPSIEDCRATFKSLRSPALSYWFLNLQMIAAHHSDVLIAAVLLSPQQIAVLVFGQRALAIVVSLYNNVLAAYWPHWTELSEKGAWKEIAKDGRALYTVTIGGVYCAVPFAAIWFFYENVTGINGTDALLMLVGATAYLTFRLHSETTSIQLISAGESKWMAQRMIYQVSVSLLFQLAGAATLGVAGLWLGLAASIGASAFWLWPKRLKYLANIPSPSSHVAELVAR